MTDLGTWLDDRPAITLAPRYLDALRSLPLRHVAVMADGPEPGLADAKWSLTDLEALAVALPQHHRVLTLWGAPDVDRMRELALRVPAMLRALGTTWVEVDLEGVGGWRQSGVRGYRNLHDAGAALVRTLRDAGATTVEVTTFPGMLPRVRGAIEGGADRLVLQVYATERKTHTIASAVEALRKARARYPLTEVCAGVAAYKQPGADSDERANHMFDAIEAASHECSTVRLWSAKHLARTTAKRYSRAALLAL